MAERLGTLIEEAGDASVAIDHYLRAIEIDPLSEVFYRRLMRVYAHLDRRAEALGVYQRCRQSLIGRARPPPVTRNAGAARGVGRALRPGAPFGSDSGRQRHSSP
jgi:DNA-binding SARP family transcriptional activator